MLHVMRINDCKPRTAGAITEMCRIVNLPGPSLFLVKTSSPWTLVYSNQEIDDFINRSKVLERNMEIVRIWSNNPYLRTMVCPENAICWCLAVLEKEYSNKDVFKHTTLATIETFRTLGINAFLKKNGFPAVTVNGIDKVLSTPPAIVRHGEWLSSFAIVWWRISQDDIGVMLKAKNNCIMQFDKEDSGFIGVEDISSTVDIDKWFDGFSEALATRLGLKTSLYQLSGKDQNRFQTFAQKLEHIDWVEQGIHPEIRHG